MLEQGSWEKMIWQQCSAMKKKESRHHAPSKAGWWAQGRPSEALSTELPSREGPLTKGL